MMFFKCLLSGGKSSLSCWHRSKPYSHHSPHRGMTYQKEMERPHEFQFSVPHETSRDGKIFQPKGIVDILSETFGRHDAIDRIYNVKTSIPDYAGGGAMLTCREAEQLRQVPGVISVTLDKRRLARGFAFEQLKERDDEKALSIIHKRRGFFCGHILGDSPFCSHCVYNTHRELITLSEIEQSSKVWTILISRLYDFPMKVTMVDEFIRVLTQIVHCEVESRLRIITVATRNYYFPGFTAFLPSDLDLTMMNLPQEVKMVIPGAQPIVKAPRGWRRE